MINGKYNQSRAQNFTATHLNFYEFPSSDPSVIEVWSYTDKISYHPGEIIQFHTSTRADSYTIEVLNDTVKSKSAYASEQLKGEHFETPSDCYEKGCGWPVTHEWTIPADCKTGGYLIISKTTDEHGQSIEHEHFVIIKDPVDTASSDILLICGTSTWVAYNNWGGCNSYEGTRNGPDDNMMSPLLHLHRPWAKGQVWLPVGAPRIPLPQAPRRNAVPRYPHMEWAYTCGYSKYYAAAGWASYERIFAHWTEKNQYEFSVACQHDIHTHPELLEKYKCVVFVGHDEYWSSNMRDAVESYTTNGGNIARFGANFIWQVRLENDGLTQVCYKYPAPYHGIEDPLKESNPELLTGVWDHTLINRPSAETFGLSGICGVYSGLGGLAPRNSGGFTVFRQDHWVFENTDLYYGDTFGSLENIHAYEVDGIGYNFEHGLPFPSGETKGVPEDLEILAMGFASMVEEDHGNKGTYLYAGDADSRLISLSMYGDDKPENMAKTSRGAGMIASFTKGKGQVVNVGTCEWVNGLLLKNEFVEQITHNVLTKFTQ